LDRIRRRSMADITRELEALRALTSRQLAKKYLELFGMPTRSNNREYLLRQIAWKLQDDGGHFEKVRKRVAELAPHVDVPVSWQQKAARAAGLTQVLVPVAPPVEAPPPTSDRDPRLPPPGSVLVREYEGKRHEVVVLDDGFE